MKCFLYGSRIGAIVTVFVCITTSNRLISQHPFVYQKIGSIGYRQKVFCYLPEDIGEQTMMSFIPTTGFYKGYKRRVIISRKNNQSITLLLQEKTGSVHVLYSNIRVKKEKYTPQSVLPIQIDPSGTMYIAALNTDKNVDTLVKIELPMPSQL